MKDSVFQYIDGMTEAAADLQRELVAIPALGPKNGGQGERIKADWLKAHLAGLGFSDIREFNAPDDAVDCGQRPNLVAVLPGQDTSRTCWILSHIDVVPPGDPELWDSDPWTLKRDGDTIIGRGVEDNHHGLVASVLAARAFLDQGLAPAMNLGLVLVADEETGSHHGLEYLVREHADVFDAHDLFLVPDFGVADSSLMEVAEKSMLWLKVTVNGKQCHASTPEQGVNSLVAAAALILEARRRLHEVFDAEDALFDPPRSTFEPTRKDANVENVNTLPGRDVFYLDSRVLPQYRVDDVIDEVRACADAVEAAHPGISIELEEVLKEQAAPATPADAEVVTRLAAAIAEVHGVTARPGGVGGGTVAAFLRRCGFPAVVWATLGHEAHQPNERASLANILADAKVMAALVC